MKKAVAVKKKKDGFQCCVCGEKTDDPQICCGHPMIEIITSKDFLNWELLSALENV